MGYYSLLIGNLGPNFDPHPQAQDSLLKIFVTKERFSFLKQMQMENQQTLGSGVEKRS